MNQKEFYSRVHEFIEERLRRNQSQDFILSLLDPDSEIRPLPSPPQHAIIPQPPSDSQQIFPSLNTPQSNESSMPHPTNLVIPYSSTDVPNFPGQFTHPEQSPNSFPTPAHLVPSGTSSDKNTVSLNDPFPPFHAPGQFFNIDFPSPVQPSPSRHTNPSDIFSALDTLEHTNAISSQELFPPSLDLSQSFDIVQPSPSDYVDPSDIFGAWGS